MIAKPSPLKFSPSAEATSHTPPLRPSFDASSASVSIPPIAIATIAEISVIVML